MTPSQLAERYRRTARKLRSLAENMSEDEGRAAVLHAADGYDEMARLAGTIRRPKPNPEK